MVLALLKLVAVPVSVGSFHGRKAFPAKAGSEKIKPDSLVGCHTGQCIQLSQTIHGFVLLRTSRSVVSAAALPTLKVSSGS